MYIIHAITIKILTLESFKLTEFVFQMCWFYSFFNKFFHNLISYTKGDNSISIFRKPPFRLDRSVTEVNLEFPGLNSLAITSSSVF
jgi:hypothetical protein